MANLGVDRYLVHVRAHALKPEAKVELALASRVSDLLFELPTAVTLLFCQTLEQ